MIRMNKDTKKPKTVEGEKKRRKSTSKKDGFGKQKKKEDPVEKLKANQTNEKENETTSEARPPSPEPNCSICLGDLQNKSFTDSCFHMFCFVCLKEWSKVKPECPLCKQKFKNIIYNVKSYEEYDRYNIAEEQQARNPWEHEGTRFRYRTTLTFERRFTFAPEHDYHQPIARPSNVTTRSHWRRYRQPSTSEFRRRVYTNGMRALETTDRRLRVRDVTPGFFRRYPATTHRLVPWLNRELNSIIPNQPDNVQLVIEIIMGLIKTYSIDSEEFYQHIYPYVGRHTRHFMHEFLSFAKSPYNMANYDSHVMYHPGAYTINSDTDDASIEDDEEIINIDDENINIREPPPERRGNTREEDLSPIFRSVRDILESESPGSYMHTPVTMAGWDSPTPGPSWQSEPRGETTICEITCPFETSVVGNRATSPIDIGSSSDSDSDSALSSASNGSDIVFVKMDKAWGERSPIMLSSDSSDTEKDMSADYVSKSKKRKSFSEKRERKKHKEHKRHKKSVDRESSKERSRHKKHKRHHSSDKNHTSSHSSSKHRDSTRSRSSSKHADISSSKTSDFEEARTSQHKSKHKKHKKHKNHDRHKKSRSNSKIQSVIVLPNSGGDTVGKTSSGTNSADPLFPAAAVMMDKDTLSTSGRDLTKSSMDSPYKKHSSGHKKSAKLVDIVPKLLEKRNERDAQRQSKNEKKMEESSGKHNGANGTNSTAKNLDEPFIPFGIDDEILSLENSRKCLKCGLLYIPELLDSFDVCFTCKKKKVCETETRSFSDFIHELSKNHATSSCSSVPRRSAFTENKNQTITIDPEKDKPNNEDNIVIQEGNENSLRPALNQVDLTSVDAPLLDTTESETDDCELVTQENKMSGQNSNSLYLDSELNSQSPFKNGSQKTIGSNDNPLAIDFSNPPTPLKGLSQNSGRTGTSSPTPWSLEVSNPPTPTSSDWPGYMAPRSLNKTPESAMLEPLFPKVSFDSLSFDPYGFPSRHNNSNCHFRNSFSPMSFSSIYHDSPVSRRMKPNPISIDVDNGFDILNRENDRRVTISCGFLPASSSESICLSDSDDSVQSVDVCSEGKSTSCVDFKTASTSFLPPFLILSDTGKDCSVNSSLQSSVVNSSATQMSIENLDQNRTNSNAEPIENAEEMEIGKLYDDETVVVSQWKIDDSENMEGKNITFDQESCKKNDISARQHSPETLAFLESPTLEDFGPKLNMSSIALKQDPKSMEEKLSGLTDFPPHVLENIDKGKRLSFHSILSDVKSNSSDSDFQNSMDHSMLVDNDNSVEKIPVSTVQDVVRSSELMSVSTSHNQIDSLVGNFNENLNSMDRFEVDNTLSRPNSASMNSFCVNGNFTLNENSDSESLKGLVGSVDSDNTEDGIRSSSNNLPLSFPLFTSNQNNSESGLNMDDHIQDKQSPITMEDQESSNLAFKKMEELTDYNDCVDSDSDHDGRQCNDDRLIGHDQSDTNDGSDMDLHQTEVTSDTDNELEDDNNTVEYRVDILHSEKKLANLFDKDRNDGH